MEVLSVALVATFMGGSIGGAVGMATMALAITLLGELWPLMDHSTFCTINCLHKSYYCSICITYEIITI